MQAARLILQSPTRRPQLRPLRNGFLQQLPIVFIVWAFVFLSARQSAYGKDMDETLHFAEHLFQEGDYYRAITEYKRFLFRETNPAIKQWVELRIGQSYLAGKKYSAAQSVFYRLSNETSSKEMTNAATFLLGRSYYLDGRYNQALDKFAELLSVVHQPELRSASWYLFACTNLRMGKLDNARESLDHVSAYGTLGKKAQTILSFLHRRKNLPHKSVVIAGLLSVVPGLGHVYLGEYGVGLSAFVWNGMFAYASVESFRHRLWGPGVLLAVVELMWYSGTIYGAVSGAHRFNRDAQLNFLQELDDHVGLDSTFPVDDAFMSLSFTGRF